VRHRTPSNSAPLQLARRVHKRSLVPQAAEHVEICVPELLERISSLADEDRLAVGGIVVRSWGRSG